ncbi:MAG TPA: Hsp20/alpha crystallin family protein [Thermoanaerobaculia bacterium]|jgi:HSP20 family protein|nr:Hsp20/alpha crystallin family protein [Thermoanaerobaculia bacterium]
MAPLKKIYLEELGRIQDRIHDLFEQALLASEYDERDGSLPGTWAPSVDVLETEDSFLVFAELPGVRRDDIQLQVKDRRLEISGRRPSLGENRNFLRMERSYGPFRRTFELSSSVDADGVAASFENGVLKILVPKRSSQATAVPVRSQEES